MGDLKKSASAPEPKPRNQDPKKPIEDQVPASMVGGTNWIKLSSAKPATHEGFKTKDDRTIAFNLIKEIEGHCRYGIDNLDNKIERKKVIERIYACCDRLQETI